MNFNLKNIGLAALGVTAVAATGYGIYRAFKKEESPATKSPAAEVKPAATNGTAQEVQDRVSKSSASNTSDQAHAYAEFVKLHTSARREIPFDSAWENGTGYFDHACKMVELAPGETARSEDTHGRPILLVGVRGGTIVVFKRYSEAANLLLCSNSPKRTLVDLEIKSPVSYEDMTKVANYVLSNEEKKTA